MANPKFSGRDTSKKSTLLDTFRMDKEELTNPKTITDGLCNYFTEVGLKLAKSISKRRKEYHEYLPGTLNDNSIYLAPTDQNEIRKI